MAGAGGGLVNWPWTRTEKRESQPFTDSLVSALFAGASGTVAADPSGLAALEVAAGLYARCFAAAEVSPETAAISPAVRALIGRDLVRGGESVHLIEVTGGQVELIPVGSWDVRGPWTERDWWYRCDLFGPSGNVTRFVPAAGVVHVRYAVDPARPWFGVAPLDWARSTGTLAAYLETRLGQEAGGSVGHLVPIPQDGGDGSDEDPLGPLKADIAAAKGRPVLVETTSAGMGEGRSAAPQTDWQPRRFGANPPPVLPTLRRDVFEAVLSTCGVPVSLVTDADGTSQRESFRRFLTTAVQPVADLVAEELARKLDQPIRFRFEGLYAHDLAGRAQAFQKLVAGGMNITQALAVSGLVISEGT